MFFYKSSQTAPKQLSASTVKGLILAAGISYPVGTIWLLNVPTEGFTVPEALGYGLILVALFSTAALISSTWQRIANDESATLDERELLLQSRANAFAFRVLSGVVLMAVIYLALAADFGGWLPSKYEHFNAIFWGVFLMCSLLPTAFLVWTEGDVPEDG